MSADLDAQRQIPTSPQTVRAMLWRRPTSLIVAGAVLVAFAVRLAIVTPLGPVTTAEAFVTMLLALAVGTVVGVLVPNRWTLLAAPAFFAVAFEVARIGTPGPLAGMPDFNSALGIIAFLVGRLIPAALTLIPMVLGLALGMELAAHLGHPSARRLRWPGRVAGVVVALFLVWLVVAMARPATTAPVLGSDGEPLAGSITELTNIELGGHEQALMIRGRSVDNPVLLYLHGGPGGTDIGAVRQDTGLEENFVVVTWDQRGAGRSFPALEPAETLTVDSLVSDAVELSEYLRDRFGQERIYLVGQSWGSILGALTVTERPELFHAFVGIGQMVDPVETDVMFWEDTLAWAEATEDSKLADRLRSNGPPPYSDVAMYAHAVSYEHAWNPYPELDLGNEMPAILFVPEYTFMERINAFRGFLESAAVLYPQLVDVDLRSLAPALEVPYTMVMGEHEARGRAVPAEEWFAQLVAPSKELVIFNGAGHRAQFDKPAEFAELMRGIAEESVR